MNASKEIFGDTATLVFLAPSFFFFRELSEKNFTVFCGERCNVRFHISCIVFRKYLN
jgi:hypothetical protein